MKQNILGKVRELSQVGAILPGYEAERDAEGSHYDRRLGRIWRIWRIFHHGRIPSLNGVRYRQ
jgi:hypothetical protein